jgi:diguanylate cyclase (GGDEF)-like protein
MERRNIKVIMCDDDPADRSLVRQLLKKATTHEFSLIEVSDGSELMQALDKEPIDVILLDVQLPGRSGLDLLEEINAKNIAPVVMATGFGDEMMAVEAMKLGAYDYLPKMQLSASSLARVVTNALDKWQMEREISHYRKEIVYMAKVDELTGINNRRSLLDSLKSAIEKAQKDGSQLNLFTLDIDFFKKVNDTYGHDAGDEVLVGVTKAVQTCLPMGAIFGRQGGEEFMVVLPGRDLDFTRETAEKCRSFVEDSTLIERDGLNVKATVSLGIAGLSETVNNFDEIIKQADLALYKAKENGRNRVELADSLLQAEQGAVKAA